MKAVLEKLASFRHLAIGWDSYGAKMIDREAIAAAQQLVLRGLPAGDWQAVPGPDGSVQLELHEGGIDIEICVSNAHKPTASKP